MPAPRKLDPDRLTLTEVEEELLFTLLVTRNTPEAKGQVAAIEKLHTDTVALAQQGKKIEEAKLEAEVLVSLANRGLDLGVAGLRAMVNGKTDGDTESPLYRRYFGQRRPSEVIRMALAAELPIVEPWVASLKAETDADLKAQGAALEKLVAAGKAALAAQGTARQAQKVFDTGPRAALFDQLNTGRVALYAELTKVGPDAAWVESFFRQPARRRPEEPQDLTVAAATAQLVAQQQAVAAAEAALAAAKQREAESLAAAQAREAHEKEIAATRKDLAALRSHLAELESQIPK